MYHLTTNSSIYGSVIYSGCFRLAHSSPNGSRKESYWRYLVRNWKPLPVGVGVTLLAILQWRHIQERENIRNIHVEKVYNWKVMCYEALPLRTTSRVWGWLANRNIPQPLRPFIFSLYARIYKCNLDEIANSDLKSYKNLVEFFCRALKDGVRPIDSKSCVVSPADGIVLTIGKVKSCRVEQVKGMYYHLKTFIGQKTWNNEILEKEHHTFSEQKNHKCGSDEEYVKSLLQYNNTNLYECVIYLAPGDYHRFHSPVDWKIGFRRHFQGYLLSVNPRVARNIPDLFSINERAVYVGQWKFGFFCLAAIGATNVGSIHVFCDEDLITNQRWWKDSVVPYRDEIFSHPSLSSKKGDLFGEFRMGSTIVLLFEGPKDLQFRVKTGSRIHMGEAICRNMNEIKVELEGTR